MAIIQFSHNPSSRIETGDTILARAKKANTKSIASHMARFKKAHAVYRAAEKRVAAAETAHHGGQVRLATADVAQDESVFGLAAVLPAEGLPRANPFGPLGEPGPAVVARQGYATEVATVERIAKALSKRNGLSARTKKAIADALAAGAHVKKMLAAMPALEEAYAKAIKQRDALAQEWETSLASIKFGARSAELNGAGGLVDALLKAAPKKPTARAKKAAKTRAANAAKKAAPKQA